MIIDYTIQNHTFLFDTNTRLVTVKGKTRQWSQDAGFQPSITVSLAGCNITLLFDDASDITTEEYNTSVAFGMRTRYSNWKCNGDVLPLSFETITWVHKTSGKMFFELIPLQEEQANVEFVSWPVPWQWNESDEQSYSVFPMMQGTLIPASWPKKFKPLGHPHFCSKGAYMPWFGQVSRGDGFLQIAVTPWDCGFHLSHEPGGPTVFYFKHLPSLGKIAYKRIIQTEFYDNCDYNTLCKGYRNFVRERGKLITLKQKQEANPKLSDLFGSPIIHSEIYYYIKPQAYIYDKEKPKKNYRFATFEQRAKQLELLAERGLKKAYLHLDGWGVDGYDQQHPDILPPCEKAGGSEKMRELAETCKKLNILFALHDQYRDYYFDASSYAPDNAVHNNGCVIPQECTWNGGEQNYLCASLAQYYIERNYQGLADAGILPDGVYLDVFAATVPDECFHKEHRMTRKECVEYRAHCLEYLRANGIIASSEEAVDTMLPHMDLVHHAPYPGIYVEDNQRGIPVPLTNLVYHDCIVTPWAIRGGPESCINDNWRFLQALLNGGPAYLSIDADDSEMERVEVVSRLSEQVCTSEMVKHEFLNSQFTVERTTFANGITVTVNFDNNTYQIENMKNCRP